MTNNSKDNQRRAFCADVVVTALEGGIGYWSAAEEYRWWSPDLPGGTATPDLAGCPVAYAVIVPSDDPESDGEHWPQLGGGPRFRVDPDAVRRAITAILSGQVHAIDPGGPFGRRLREAVRDNDAGDLDADDADTIVQVAAFGEVIYG